MRPSAPACRADPSARRCCARRAATGVRARRRSRPRRRTPTWRARAGGTSRAGRSHGPPRRSDSPSRGRARAASRGARAEAGCPVRGARAGRSNRRPPLRSVHFRNKCFLNAKCRLCGCHAGSVTRVRTLGFVFGLAGRRVRRRLGAVSLAMLGIAAGGAAMATVLGASTIAQDQSLARALRRLPAEERTVRASWFGVFDAREYAKLDAGVRRALPRLQKARPIRVMQFRQADVNGKAVDLAAADRLSSWVRVRSGRLPRTCTAALCEVVQVAGHGPLPDVRGLHLRRVGVGDLVSKVPFLQTTAYGRMVEDTYSFTP